MLDPSRAGRLAFVPARYGPGITGGAEIVMRQMAMRLRDRGWDTEILTTCATDHFTWANVLPAGAHVEDGLPVRRFPTVVDDLPERGILEHAIQTGAELTLAQQDRWMNSGMRVPELFHYLLDHAEDYRAIVFGPYPFWVAFAGGQVAPERTLLLSCLHDEPYVRLELFQPVLSGVAGLLLLSEPEHELAHEILERPAPHAVVGCGVEVPASYDPDGFRARYGIEGRFLLYAGRREGGKGWPELLRGFAAACRRSDLPFSIVTMGSGEVDAPAEIADRVIDVGFLPDDERDSAFAAADGYLQPSRFESFSRTIMEAWLAGTPVIGNAASAVVRWHCDRSGAGLVYDDDAELEECLRFLADAPEAANAMAAAGRAYVLEHYQWDAVLDRVEGRIEAWSAAPSPVEVAT